MVQVEHKSLSNALLGRSGYATLAIPMKVWDGIGMLNETSISLGRV